MGTWTLRYWPKPNSEQEKAKPEVSTVYDDRGIGGDLQHFIDKYEATRVEAVRWGRPVEPKKKPPVKVQRIEWEQDETYPKGERWRGQVNGKYVAEVTHLDESWGGGCHYHLELGSFGSGYHDVANVESGKRAAQAAFSKAVKSMLA